MAIRKSRVLLRGLIVTAGLLLLVAGIALTYYFSGLRYRGQGLDYWVIQLKQGDQRNKAAAREALHFFGARAVPPLVGMLERQDPVWKVNLVARFPMLYGLGLVHMTSRQDRAYAAAALGELGPQATHAIPVLESLGPTLGVSYQPMIDAALMKIKGQSLTRLIQGLADFEVKDWDYRVRTVAEFGAEARSALPMLCKALNEPKAHHWTAAYAIGFIHSESSLCACQPSLRMCGLGRVTTRVNSIWALGEFEAEARAAMPILWQKVKDPDAMVRQTALGSLKRILPPEQRASLLPALKANVNDPDPNLSGGARYMLRELRATGVK